MSTDPQENDNSLSEEELGDISGGTEAKNQKLIEAFRKRGIMVTREQLFNSVAMEDIVTHPENHKLPPG